MTIPTPVILVVEDDAGVRKMLETMIPQLGYDVRVAVTGKEAVRLYQKGNQFDLVLMDVRMPDMDGPQALLELKKIDPKIVCCFMTGHSGEYTHAELLSFGAVVVIDKPFGASDLQKIIQEFIGKRT